MTQRYVCRFIFLRAFPDYHLTDEQRSQMRGDKLDLTDFARFLVNKESYEGESAIRSIVYNVESLRRGCGISPDKGCNSPIFHPRPIDLGEDLNQLLADGYAHCEKYGRQNYCRYLESSLQALRNYQKFYYDKLIIL